MSIFALRVDRIVSHILSEQPPSSLTFERAHTAGLITYTLRLDRTLAGQVKIEQVTDPEPGLKVNLSNHASDPTARAVINHIYNLLMAAIEFETGRQRWPELIDNPQPFPDQIALTAVLPEFSSQPTPNAPPWESIPDHLWDRLAIQLWCAGLSNQEIGLRLSLQPRTVTNRISMLRQSYPQAGIPTHKQRLKRMFPHDSQ